MYLNIFKDFWTGVSNSVRFDKILFMATDTEKIKNIIIKICKYNLLMHVMPIIIVNICQYLFNIQLLYIHSLIVHPINIFSICFHMLYYMDLINASTTYAPQIQKTLPVSSIFSMAITMALYNLIIYASTVLLDIITHDKIYLLVIFVKYIILSFYHSFYCFNNLWQYKKFQMDRRIDIHEKLWPYYIGYGSLATVIYFYTTYTEIIAIYNTYMMCLIMLPFIVQEKYPRTSVATYPSINLSLFGYLLGYFHKAIKYLAGV